MARLDSFLKVVVDQRASDLHFHAGMVPSIRYMGDILQLPFRELTEEETRRFLLEIMTDEQRDYFLANKDIDFAYRLEGVGRFRASVFTQSRGIGAVFRVIPEKPITVDELRLPPAVARLAKLKNGLVLVTGPTGSGKTTTLSAMIHEINRTSSKHIITIEDPIEYIHEPLQSAITQRELGKHTNNATAALRAALREAPDVLVVGELRDFETISLALSAAETGVLVLGTLHTNSAAKAVDRIVSACPEEAQGQVVSVLSVLIKGVLAQHLCKLASGDGRVAAVEILLQTYAVSNLIREGKVYQIDAYLKSDEHSGSGAQALDTALFDFVTQGLVTLEDALAKASEPDVLRERIERFDADLELGSPQH